MRRHLLMILSLTLVATAPLSAGSFTRTPIAPDLGVDALTLGVARQQVGRDLFANPYATVTISNVDVYDRFPYVESRDFQIVSDPRWNRLVYGERARSLRAYDGQGTPLGALSQPRGMAVDEANRVYVADTGNDRIVVLQATTEYGDIDLVPLYAITGLSGPYDVAYSDGGTPFVPGDDQLYVADTGRNRVVAFALASDGARMITALGELGSGPGRFAGPMAIAVGQSERGNTRDVYVADAHTRRLAHLRLESNRLRWIGDVQNDADVVTSLDTDRWGNVYAAAPRQGVVRKFNAALAPVAELRDGLAHPRGFQVAFVTVNDHRSGTITRTGQPTALSVEDWSTQSGITMWRLGVSVADLRVSDDGAPTASFTLTDRAQVALEVRDGSGRTLSQRSIGALDAGTHSVSLLQDVGTAATTSDLVLRLTADSSYPDGASDVAQAHFGAGGGAGWTPAQPILIGNMPNPGAPWTRIVFMLPANPGGRIALHVFDALGRRVRTFGNAFGPGRNEVLWDGMDDRGRGVRAGVYVYRLDVGDAHWTQRMVLVRPGS